MAKYAKDEKQNVAKDERAIEQASKAEKDLNEAVPEGVVWSIDQ